MAVLASAACADQRLVGVKMYSIRRIGISASQHQVTICTRVTCGDVSRITIEGDTHVRAVRVSYFNLSVELLNSHNKILSSER